MPALGGDRRTCAPRHVVLRYAICSAGDQGQRRGQKLLRPIRADTVEWPPDGSHHVGTVNTIEDRLIVAHLPDDALERVVRHDRWRRIVSMPDLEIRPEPDIEIVSMGHCQSRVSIENIEQPA